MYSIWIESEGRGLGDVVEEVTDPEARIADCDEALRIASYITQALDVLEITAIVRVESQGETVWTLESGPKYDDQGRYDDGTPIGG